MLNLITIDRIFEESWKTYTNQSSWHRKEFITLYLHALEAEVTKRTDRKLPRMEAFIEAIKPLIGDGQMEIGNNEVTVSFPDQTFTIEAHRKGRFYLTSQQSHFFADLMLWEPGDTALLMYAAGNFREKAGKRWDEYNDELKEKERIIEISQKYSAKKSKLLDRYAKALVDGTATDCLVDTYSELLQEEWREKNLPFNQDQLNWNINSFREKAEKKKKTILSKRRAAERAREKRRLEKEKDEQRYNVELQHLIKVVGIVPDISLHKPWYRPHYQEYCFTLSNGMSIKVRNYDKSPSKVEKEVLRLIRKLKKD